MGPGWGKQSGKQKQWGPLDDSGGTGGTLGGVAGLEISNSKTQLRRDVCLQQPGLGGDGGSLSGPSKQTLEQRTDR